MSTYKRKDGYWRVVVYYTDPYSGKRKRYCTSARTRKEGVQKESLLLSELNQLPQKDLLVDTVAEDFLKASLETRRLSTVDHYRKIYRNHIKSFFGDMKFLSVRRADIEAWKKDISKQGYSLNYERHCFKVLHLIFRYGNTSFSVSNEEISKVRNFASDPNEVTEDPVLHYWKPNEFKAFIEALDRRLSTMDRTKEDYMEVKATKVLVSICYFCGLRKGEANALLVDDFHDGDHPFIRVNKSVTQQLGIGKYVVTNPKTESSVRDVPCTEELSSLIREHIRDDIAPLDVERKYLCYGIGPIPNTTLSAIKERAEKEAGIPHIRIHDLRHSFASSLINAGVPISIISKLCGHSSPEITYRIYSHLFPETSSEAIAALESYYRKETGKDERND